MSAHEAGRGTSTERRAVATRWEQIPDELVREGVRRRAFGNQNAMLVMNTLTPGMEISPHVHEDFDQIAYIVSGTAIYSVDGVGHEVGPGSLLLIPAGQVHYIQATGTEPVLNLDVFGPARSDLIHLLDWMKER